MKNKKRKSLKLLIFSLLFCLVMPFGTMTAIQKVNASTTLSDGSYIISVTLWKAAQDQVSMGNGSLEEAKLEVENGKGTLYLKFKAMTFSGMEGYLSQLDLLENIKFDTNNQPKTYDLKPSTVVSTFSVVDPYNSSSSTDVNTAGKSYPKVVSFPVDIGDDLLWAQVYVPIKGSLGFGEQTCRIKIDYDQVEEMGEEDLSRWKEYEQSDKAEENESDSSSKEDKSKLKTQIQKATKLVEKVDQYTEASLNKLNEVLEAANKVYQLSNATQEAVDNQVTLLKDAMSQLVEKSGENLDKDHLSNGKYRVYVDLWNATSNAASMGNLALNKKALLTVKNGVYTMEISTRPMTVGTITACLQTLQIKQTNGKYKYAKITARNNEGNQPSVFQFTLPSKNEYIDVLIDPKVEVMGDDPLEARLKISWDTLSKVADDETIEENTEAAVSGTFSKAVNWTDKKTGVKVKAEANIIEDGATYKVTTLSSGSEYRSIVKLFDTEAVNIVYDVSISDQKGNAIQPNGMVQISIPISSTSNQNTVSVYRVLDGTKTKMSGTVSGNYYVFSTNKMGAFVVTKATETSSNGSVNQTMQALQGSSSVLSGQSAPTSSVLSNQTNQDSEDSSEEESEDEVEENAEEVTTKEQPQNIIQIYKQIVQSNDEFGKIIALVVLGISMMMSFALVVVVLAIGIRQMKKRG